MTSPKQVLVSLSICLTIMMGCNESAAETGKKLNTKQGSLSIGLVPELNIFKQLERYEPLGNYLSKKTGLKIELRIFTRHGDIIDGFVGGDLDAAFLGSFTYALVHSKMPVDAIARPENVLGKSTTHGLIFVRKDSGIRNVNDMKGKTLAFVDKATTAGYLFPIAYLKEYGIDDPHTYFNEIYFTGTYQDAVYDVVDKKADISAVKNTVIKSLAAGDSRIKNELVFLAKSVEMPDNSLVVRKELDDAIKTQLKSILLNMHLEPDGKNVLKDFGAKRFIETSAEDYAGLYRHLQKLHLNLSTYVYSKEP